MIRPNKKDYLLSVNARTCFLGPRLFFLSILRCPQFLDRYFSSIAEFIDGFEIYFSKGSSVRIVLEVADTLCTLRIEAPRKILVTEQATVPASRS